MRTWLHSLYRDLHAIPATQFSVDPDQWNLTVICLSDQLVFEKRPSGSAIPVGGRLVQVRHQHVSTLSDVSRCLISDKRIWLGIRDPASSKRRLSVSSLGDFRTLNIPPMHDDLQKGHFLIGDSCAGSFV